VTCPTEDRISIADVHLTHQGSAGYTHSMMLKGSNRDLLINEARRIASVLICQAQEPVQRPCGHCAHCRQMMSNVYPYWFEIAPQGAASLIRIGQIRELRTKLMSKAGEGQAKIAVLTDAHRMRDESQNSLLKILEEPPQDTLMLLLTGRPQDLLPTVRSRCRIIDYGNEKLIPEQTELDLVGDVIRAIRSQGYRGVFDKAAFVEGSRKKSLQGFFGALEYLLRNGMVESLCRMEKESGTAASSHDLIEALNQVWLAAYLMERNVNALLVLENLFLKLKKLDIRVI